MKLPKYVIIENKAEMPMPFVLQTESPRLIGRPIFWDKNHTDKAEETMKSIVNGRATGVKIPGYRGFMMASGSLTREYTGDTEEVTRVLREMADFYLKEKVEPHRYTYKKHQED